MSLVCVPIFVKAVDITSCLKLLRKLAKSARCARIFAHFFCRLKHGFVGECYFGMSDV